MQNLKDREDSNVRKGVNQSRDRDQTENLKLQVAKISLLSHSRKVWDRSTFPNHLRIGDM